MFLKTDFTSFLSPFLSVHSSNETIATFFTLFSSLLVLYFVRLFAHSDIYALDTGLTYVAHKTTHDPFRTETDKICVLWNAQSRNFSVRMGILSRVLAHINVQTYIHSHHRSFIFHSRSIIHLLTQAHTAHMHTRTHAPCRQRDLCTDRDRHGYIEMSKMSWRVRI